MQVKVFTLFWVPGCAVVWAAHGVGTCVLCVELPTIVGKLAMTKLMESTKEIFRSHLEIMRSLFEHLLDVHHHIKKNSNSQ